MSLIYVKNERNLTVSMQCWYLFLLVQNLHSCVQTLIFVCKLAFCREIRLLTSCGLSLKRNQIGYWITPTKAQKRMPTAANVRRLGANNAQKMGQIGAGFIQYNPVDFDQFNRLDFDTVVTSGQPSLF